MLCSTQGLSYQMVDRMWIRRILLLLIVYALYLWTWNSAFGEITKVDAARIVLKGHLSKQTLEDASRHLEQLSAEQLLVITVNSNSGDLIAAFELARKIYEIKTEKHNSVVVYIDDNAIGPAALFPFLADELDISLFMAWGDVRLGNEKILPINILRNRVTSLIMPSQPHAEKLRLLAAGMCDPGVRIVTDRDHNWHLANEGEDLAAANVKSKDEALVVNHNQLKELGLVTHIVSSDKFQMLYPVGTTETSHADATPTLEGAAIPPKLLMDELKKHIIYNPNGPNTIGHILLDDRTEGINQGTWLYVKKALEHYKESKPCFIILELNTPGGEVFAAQKISDALKDFDTQQNIPVVAYINNWAISAGAMLAYSCRFIVTAKDGSMGAAEPIIANAEGKMETASEKINSALRADFANRARFFDRDPLLAEAMVDKDMILVQRHGKVVKLTSDAQIHSEGTDPDLVISAKGKLLTLDAQQMIEYGVADLIVPPQKTEAITAEEKESGKWPAQKTSLFHQPFFAEIPHATIDAYRMDWKMRFFALLASPAVSSLLFLGLMVGLYFEFSTPGFGVAGTLAVTCLFLIILSSFSLEIANWLELILLLVGMGVILVELFVLPTFGLLGFIGVILFLVGLFGMMLPGIGSISFEFDTKTLNAAGYVFFERLAWLCGTLVFAFILIALLARYVTPSFSGFNRFVLKGNEQTGFIAGDNPTHLPQPGSIGEAAATLRPAGKVAIGDQLYDAISDGSFIEKGTPIIVVKLDGSTIVVAAHASSKQEVSS